MGRMIRPTPAEEIKLLQIPAMIRYYMKRDGVTDTEVSEHLKVSYSTFQNYMEDPRLMQATIILRLCDLFQTTPNELFGGTVAFLRVRRVQRILELEHPGYKTVKPTRKKRPSSDK